MKTGSGLGLLIPALGFLSQNVLVFGCIWWCNKSKLWNIICQSKPKQFLVSCGLFWQQRGYSWEGRREDQVKIDLT